MFLSGICPFPGGLKRLGCLPIFDKTHLVCQVILGTFWGPFDSRYIREAQQQELTWGQNKLIKILEWRVSLFRAWDTLGMVTICLDRGEV